MGARKAPLQVRAPEVDWQGVAALCRAEYERRPIGFDRLSRWLLATHGVRVSGTTIRVWAHGGGWKIRQQRNAAFLGLKARTRDYWLAKSRLEEDRVARLPRRCERCYAITPGTSCAHCGMERGCA